MNHIWLLRMAKWVRNPPSPKRVKLVVGVISLALILAGIEWIWGWPEALTPDRMPRRLP